MAPAMRSAAWATCSGRSGAAAHHLAALDEKAVFHGTGAGGLIPAAHAGGWPPRPVAAGRPPRAQQPASQPRPGSASTTSPSIPSPARVTAPARASPGAAGRSPAPKAPRLGGSSRAAGPAPGASGGRRRRRAPGRRARRRGCSGAGPRPGDRSAAVDHRVDQNVRHGRASNANVCFGYCSTPAPPAQRKKAAPEGRPRPVRALAHAALQRQGFAGHV